MSAGKPAGTRAIMQLVVRGRRRGRELHDATRPEWAAAAAGCCAVQQGPHGHDTMLHSRGCRCTPAWRTQRWTVKDPQILQAP